MLVYGTNILGSKVVANDGTAGKISDIYFDDLSWEIRFWVINLGRGRWTRSVLIEAAADHAFHPEANLLSVPLSTQDIADAVSANKILPVSQQYSRLQRGESASPHLRSFNSIRQYAAWFQDDAIGTIQDSLIQTEGWYIPGLLVASQTLNETLKRVTFNVPSTAVDHISSVAERVTLRSFAPFQAGDDSIIPFPLLPALAEMGC